MSIKSETISTQHKKTKNFLFVIAGIGIVIVLIGSFLTVYQKNAKAFAKNSKDAQLKEDTTSTDPIDKQEIKESWASSVERRIGDNHILLAKGIKASEASFREDALRREKVQDQKFEDIKDLILASQNSVESKIDKTNARISDVERNSKESILRLSTEIKRTKTSNKKKSTKITNSLLPPLKGSKLLPRLATKTEKYGSIIHTKGGLLPKRDGQSGIKEKPVPVVDPDKLSFFIEEDINKDIEKAFPLDEPDEAKPPLMAKQYDIGLGFFSAVTLTGAYAPIFGEDADQASIPVLLEVQGDLIVANGFSESIDRCFALGGAIGNPSSNTVDIRLTVMECILADGKHKVRGKLKGWVIGENGKPGLAGELIHKSGQYISRFILAGLLESLSAAFVTAATPENTNGATTSVITSGATQGAAEGTQNAFGRLAEFYIKLAEKTLPMIEAKAGRHVSVLVQGGELYEVTEFNALNIQDLVSDYEKTKKEGN